MKTASPLIFLVLAWLALTAVVFGQSPPEQFQAAVAGYQKFPTHESALKVIELYKQLYPAPGVPEEAREPFVMGVTILKEATGPAGAVKAVELFTQAVRIAPWWAEARYNRAVARETAGQFESAMQDLTLYLSFNLKEDERREAQDKIYALKAKAQLATARTAEIAARKAGEKAAATNERKAFEGHWIQSTPLRYNAGEAAPLSLAMCEYDISFDENGEARVTSRFRQYNSGRWIHTPPAEFRGRLEGGVLVVNPSEPASDERKRELRFSRIQQGLYYKATVVSLIAGRGEITMEYQVRR